MTLECVVAATTALFLLLQPLLQLHRIVAADCIYEGARYTEGSSVPTAEVCLRCACAQGALLCYLRVCPQLPDPPPPGCFILHRHKTCCSELICTDFLLGTNRLEARIEPDIPEIPYNHSMIGNGCIYNGTIYGSGSAMTTSSLCEYCYCISGRQKCVKPRCLLPIEGCTALYAQHSCCPTHYKCNNRKRISTTSTSSAPIHIQDTGGGCYVSTKLYTDGGKILGVGHSPCDNCYCIRGVVRCMPLSCAPALLGCTPVVPQGECCAASYNCSGVIEVQPKLNYGHYPVVSKEYAKLRKEVQRKTPPPSQQHPDSQIPSDVKSPHYVIAQSSYNIFENKNQKPSTPYYFTTPQSVTSSITPTVRHIPETTRHLPLTIESLSPDTNQYSRISLTTTKVNNNQDQSNVMRPVFKPSKFLTNMELTTDSPVFLSPVYKHLDSPAKNSKNYLSLLTTPDEGLTYSSILSKRKFELSTPKILKYSNYVDTDFTDDIFSDGRNNRRIDDQVTAESNIDLSSNFTSTTELSTTQETTESTLSTDITSTTVAEESSTETTTENETSTQETTTEISELIFNATKTSNYNISMETQTNASATIEIKETTPTVSPKISLKNETVVSENISNSEIIGNNTECIEGLINANDSALYVKESIDYLANETDVTTNEVASDSETDTTSTDSPTTLYSLFVSTKHIANNLAATSLPFKKISPEIETILNITETINKKDEDYEYDYNEPSLPPSLPNLKIIPFVAADAVVEDKGSATATYPTAYPAHPPDGLRGTDDPLYGYTLNLFSPPIETEGGFVPRDPPILNNFYENAYHTTGIVDITAGTAVPAITNAPKTNEDDCVVEGREIRHGELTSELGACSVCLCLFGVIACQPPKCPPPPAGCRRVQKPQATPVCCGHIVCNGDAESPTVVLDRIDATSNSQDTLPAQVLATPDPFRDVIRTEQAPDLQSLIGDIMPYLVRQTSTLKSTTHMTTPKSTPPLKTDIRYTSQIAQSTTELPVETKHEEENNFSLDSVLQFFFPTDKDQTTEKHVSPNNDDERYDGSITQLTTQSKYRTTPAANMDSWYLSSKTQPDLTNRNSIDIPSSVGLLKLAGCNIYGRMYRVGKIISELSGPCLECMCAEIGVQCRSLTC